MHWSHFTNVSDFGTLNRGSTQKVIANISRSLISFIAQGIKKAGENAHTGT
jgi:hypothetical protein